MKQRIERGVAAMGISLPPGAAEMMGAYWDRLLVANQTLNLTRITDPDEACAAHFLDSFAPLIYGKQMIPQGASLLDVGTGAGFPGVPLAMARPDLSVTLLDARKKRLVFIETALAGLGVSNIRTVHARAEDLPSRYDVVCARAVAALPALCRLLVPLLRPSGLALMWKGPGAAAEMQEAARACSSIGARLLKPTAYDLPDFDRKLCLIAAERTR